MTRVPFATIDAYIASFPNDFQKALKRIRATIKRAVPEAISFNIAAFRLGQKVVYFGAFKKHIGLFPPVRDAKLQSRICAYQGEKGNLQFPLDRPMDYALIAYIAKSQLRPRREEAAKKRPAKKKRKL